MKNCVLLLLMMILLTGCGAEQTMETVADELVIPVMAQPRLICVELPGETALPVFENDNGRIYICNDYEIAIQTLESGDLEQTIQTISGLSKQDVPVVATSEEDIRRFDLGWASVGEGGDRGGRAAILDDGNYHYCMSVLRGVESDKSQISWDQVFGTFHLS